MTTLPCIPAILHGWTVILAHTSKVHYFLGKTSLTSQYGGIVAKMSSWTKMQELYENERSLPMMIC